MPTLSVGMPNARGRRSTCRRRPWAWHPARSGTGGACTRDPRAVHYGNFPYSHPIAHRSGPSVRVCSLHRDCSLAGHGRGCRGRTDEGPDRRWPERPQLEGDHAHPQRRAWKRPGYSRWTWPPPATRPRHERFRPDLAAYKLVVLNYQGDDWPEATQKAFVDYVFQGGGVVCYHFAAAAFPKWKEYNRIIGIGGWGGRNETAGPYLCWATAGRPRHGPAGQGRLPWGPHRTSRSLSRAGASDHSRAPQGVHAIG